MGRNPITMKGLTVGIILFFIGVAIAPSINTNVVKASHEDQFITVTTHACGIEGFRDTTVKLTREQYNDLEQYLVGFRARLNQTSTREETARLFRHVVVILHSYGLLPEHMSIKEAQRVVTGAYQRPRLRDLYHLMNRNKQAVNDSNVLCLLTGTTTSTTFLGIAELSVAALIYLLYFPYFLEKIVCDDPVIMQDVLMKLHELCTLLRTISLRRAFQTGTIVFGTSKEEYIPPEFRFSPAHGWIDTQGLIGKKSWEGTFFGSIRVLRSFEFRSYSYYVGATGFAGIKLNKGDGKNFFLGSAVHCDVDYFEY